MKPKCNCLSQPQYHRDDCLYYDSHGNLKNGINSINFGVSEIDQVFSQGIYKNNLSQFRLDSGNEESNVKFLCKLLNHNFKTNDLKLLIFNNPNSALINIGDFLNEISYSVKNKTEVISSNVIWKNTTLKHITKEIDELMEKTDVVIFIGLENERVNHNFLFKNHNFLQFIEKRCNNKFVLFFIDQQYYGTFFTLNQMTTNMFRFKADYSQSIKRNTYSLEIIKCNQHVNKTFFSGFIL